MEVNSNIVEYDLHHANTSLMRYYHLYPVSFLDKLDRLDKMAREVYVGKLQRDNKEFSKVLMQSFDSSMKMFLDANGITEDNLIAIKKDAAFVVNKKVNVNVFTNEDKTGVLNFRPKNVYKHYAHIGLYEIYIKENGEVDVKGIGDRDAIILHKNGMLKFIFDLLELYDEGNITNTMKYLHEFVDNYKSRKLPFDYYREFNSVSSFKCYINDEEIILDDLDESVINECDITWNYFNVILPAIRIFI